LWMGGEFFWHVISRTSLLKLSGPQIANLLDKFLDLLLSNLIRSKKKILH